jgi:ribosomal-protein-alanine N-acetyltransferase
MVILQSERLYVRRYQPSDLGDFYLLTSDPDVMRYIRPVKSMEETRQFLEENIAFYDEHPELGRWALINRANETMVGSFSLLPLEHTDDIHIGYALQPPHWGLGYATEIVRAGIKHAFDNIGLLTLTAVIYPANEASAKVLEKTGFRFERSFEEEGKESYLYRLNRS